MNNVSHQRDHFLSDNLELNATAIYYGVTAEQLKELATQAEYNRWVTDLSSSNFTLKETYALKLQPVSRAFLFHTPNFSFGNMLWNVGREVEMRSNQLRCLQRDIDGRVMVREELAEWLAKPFAELPPTIGLTHGRIASSREMDDYALAKGLIVGGKYHNEIVIVRSNKSNDGSYWVEIKLQRDESISWTTDAPFVEGIPPGVEIAYPASTEHSRKLSNLGNFVEGDYRFTDMTAYAVRRHIVLARAANFVASSERFSK